MIKRARTAITGLTAAALLATSAVVVVPAAQAANAGVYSEAPIVLASHRGDGWRWRRHHHDNDFPAAVLGFGAGAIIGSMLAQPRYVEPAPRYYYSDADAYCASKFKTYKRSTGTYTGYDGYEHPCP